MSRKRQAAPDTSSSRTTMIVMAACALAVVALVAWALTRTVDPATATLPAATPAPAVANDQTTIASTTAPVTFTSSTAAPPAQPAGEQVSRISVEDFRPKFDSGNVVVIDVRDSASYSGGHIPGAMNIPFASIQGFTDMIPKGKEIVTYCT